MEERIEGLEGQAIPDVGVWVVAVFDSFFEKREALPSGSVGWSIVLYTNRLQVRFLVGAHMGGNQSMFLLLFLSLPPSLKIHKNILG